jgi:hypothetical protein
LAARNGHVGIAKPLLLAVEAIKDAAKSELNNRCIAVIKGLLLARRQRLVDAALLRNGRVAIR